MRRLLALCLGVVVIACVLVYGLRALPGQEGRPAAPTAAPTAEAHDHAVDPDPRRSRADREAALAFMTVFASGPATESDRAIWNAEMTRLCVPELAELLHWAYAERLPRGMPTGAALLEETDDAAAVRVDLDSGEPWIVVLDGMGRVSDVRPLDTPDSP